MLKYLVYLIFILSVALTAGGIILTSRLRNKYKSDIFSTLLYFQVFIFTFGFYGIWGQIVIKSFLAFYISEALLQRFTGIAMLLGLPFLVFAWLMLIQFSLSTSGRRKSKWLVFWFLLSNFLIIFGVGYLISKTDEKMPLYLIKNYFIFMNLLYSVVASLIIGFPRKGRSVIHDYDRKIIVPALIIIAAATCVPLIFYSTQSWLGLIFIMAFFAGNAFLPVYLNYGTLLSAFTTEEAEKDFSFEEFCRKFEVSPRETDIVREICNGLSNKEISDKLFISLQTVKDHTHRIYIKTNVKSRVQLITLVKEELTPLTRSLVK
jgi:DNA-binding CsgD family transcriptional regulator